MECVLCTQSIKYPVAVSIDGQRYHLIALCGYLARQLLDQKTLEDPNLIDMSRRKVEEIIQIKVEGRDLHFFPFNIADLQKNDPCDELTHLFSVDEEKLAKRIAIEFMTRPVNRDLLSLTKARMIQIRDKVLKGSEDFDDECWLASFIHSFSGMGMKGVAFSMGCFAMVLIAGQQFGKNLWSNGREDGVIVYRT